MIGAGGPLSCANRFSSPAGAAALPPPPSVAASRESAANRLRNRMRRSHETPLQRIYVRGRIVPLALTASFSATVVLHWLRAAASLAERVARSPLKRNGAEETALVIDAHQPFDVLDHEFIAANDSRTVLRASYTSRRSGHA